MNQFLRNEGKIQRRILHFWRCFWLSFLVLSLAYAWHCFYVPPNDIRWVGSYALAQRQAVESQKPMILYFTGTWCVPCRIMKREVWASDEVANVVNQELIPVMIDLADPRYSELLIRYKVHGAPVVIITDPHGQPLNWRSGRLGRSEFLDFLRSTVPAAQGGL